MHALRAPRAPRAARAATLALLAAGALAACGGGGGDNRLVEPPPPTKPVVPAPVTVTLAVAGGAPVALVQGASGTASLRVDRQGGAAPVSLVATAPAGLTATLQPAAVDSTATTAALVVTAAADLAPGSYTVTVRGTVAGAAAGTTPASVSVPVTVTAAPVPTIGVAVDSAAGFTIVQGRSASTAVRVSRGGGFAGAVTLAPGALPAGVQASAAPASLAAGETQATLTVSVAADAPPGSAALTLVATGPDGAPTATVSIPLTVAQPPAVTLAPPTEPLAVTQGATATVVVAVGRARFTGDVTVTAESPPAGITVTTGTAPAGAGTVALTIAASAQAATGPASVTLRASGPNGTPTVTGTLPIVVQAPPAPPPVVEPQPPRQTTAVAWSFCQPALPLWLAVQDEDGAWTRVAPTATTGGARYDFQLGARGGVAWVVPTGGPGNAGTLLNVAYGSLAELQRQGATQCHYLPLAGSRALVGGTAGVTGADRVVVAAGAATTVAPGDGVWSLAAVPDGAVTLLGARLPFGADGPDRVLLRRDAAVAASGEVDPLDFAGAESVAPAIGQLTVTNVGADYLAAVTALHAGRLGSGWFALSTGTGGAVRAAGLPEARLAAGELHLVTALAESATGDAVRGAAVFARSMADRTVALGPALGTPTVTVEGGAYLRPRLILAALPQYDGLAALDVQQAGRRVSLSMTPGYLGAGATTWDVTLPDLSAVAGFDAAWAPRSGVGADWQAFLFAGTDDVLLGALPREGTSYRYAVRSGTLAGGAPSASRAPAIALRLGSGATRAPRVRAVRALRTPR